MGTDNDVAQADRNTFGGIVRPTKYHVMIDLETLSTKPTSAVIQVAAVGFDFNHDVPNAKFPVLNSYVNPDTCLRKGGQVSASTLAFWLQQNGPVRGRTALGIEKGHSINKALHDLYSAFDWKNVLGVWAKPTTFDLPILTHWFDRALSTEPPWDRRRVYDVRTFYAAVGGAVTLPSRPDLVLHDALDDCIWEIETLRETAKAAPYRGLFLTGE